MYNDSMSHKFQITLPEDLAAELKQGAKRQGIPLAEFIRQTMRERMRASVPSQTASLASITGIVDGADTDLSTRVDEILYQ
jgi:hypothetical protein